MRYAVLIIVAFFSVASYADHEKDKTVVFGRVYATSGRDTDYFSDYTIVFKSVDGKSSVTAKTDYDGDYLVELRSGRYYTVEARRGDDCMLSRPKFYAAPAAKIKIEFAAILTCGGGFMPFNDNLQLKPQSDWPDVWKAVDARHSQVIPISGGSGELEVVYGVRKVVDGVYVYTPLTYGMFTKSKAYKIPAAVYMGVISIYSDRILYNIKKHIVQSVGGVTVRDGSGNPPQKFDCVELDLDKVDPKIAPCLLPDSSAGTGALSPALDGAHK